MSVILKIDDDYRIESSTTGCSLVLQAEGEINPNTNKPIEKFDQWFFPDVKACLKKYCKLQTQECRSIESVIEMIDSLMKKIDDLKI